jgi:hypothetical protein
VREAEGILNIEVPDDAQHFKLFPLISMNCIAAIITTAYHGFVNESLVLKAGATCNTPRMIRNISPRSINTCFSVK